jgi:hypothetical protein
MVTTRSLLHRSALTGTFAGALALVLLFSSGCAKKQDVLLLQADLKILTDELSSTRLELQRLRRDYSVLRSNYVNNMDFIAERIKETEQTADRARAIALRQENRDDVVEMQKAVQDLVQDLQALEQDFRRILQEQP